MFHNDSIKDFFEELHLKIIVTPVDKANVMKTLICKRLWAFNLIKEVELRESQVSTPNTWNFWFFADKTNDQLLNSHAKILFYAILMFSLILKKNAYHQSTFLIKLRKNRRKARFITAAPKYSLKSLFILIASIFNLLFK